MRIGGKPGGLRRLAIILGDDKPNSDIEVLLDVVAAAGHEPLVLPWPTLSVALSENGARLCREGRPLHVDGIIHQMSTDARDGLALLASVEDQIPHLNGVDAVLRSADKFATGVRLRERGIPTPDTAFVSDDAELTAWARAYGYPVVLKQPDGARGTEVTLARHEGELIAKAESIRERGVPLIVQRFVAEAAGRDLRVIVAGGRFVAAMEQRGPEGDFRSNGHGDTIHPVTLTQEEIEVAERTARATELDLAGIDILRGADGPVVIETNSFPGLGGFDKEQVCEAILDAIERKIAASEPLGPALILDARPPAELATATAAPALPVPAAVPAPEEPGPAPVAAEPTAAAPAAPKPTAI
ncbi:ATP-grasp domain-containing protein [Bailinhaonella thermotolerans]|uniref:ATP-grasp domain-containing protein n=1 Tax=Bailinhaonella thermotolerans TaxID=1070861 RepID=A0A3A4AYI8_9ACTN|nr:ATP-grasp domain-containing protein [Bailinhaonella thermotolerans]RJL30320.1 ATP-grasp domain-containing protein [Bailinhaonella thermotolerans]